MHQTKTNAETLYKISFVLSASWTHGLIAESVIPFEQNLVVVGPNPIQANFM